MMVSERSRGRDTFSMCIYKKCPEQAFARAEAGERCQAWGRASGVLCKEAGPRGWRRPEDPDAPSLRSPHALLAGKQRKGRSRVWLVIFSTSAGRAVGPSEGWWGGGHQTPEPSGEGEEESELPSLGNGTSCLSRCSSICAQRAVLEVAAGGVCVENGAFAPWEVSRAGADRRDLPPGPVAAPAMA